MDGAEQLPWRTPEVMFWCVKAIVAIQVEGITNGLQSYEERFLLVNATDRDEAEKKAVKEFTEYKQVYLNPYGNKVRWIFEKIEDVYETSINSYEDFKNPDGIEVYSILKNRRIKPEYCWDGKDR